MHLGKANALFMMKTTHKRMYSAFVSTMSKSAEGRPTKSRTWPRRSRRKKKEKPAIRRAVGLTASCALVPKQSHTLTLTCLVHAPGEGKRPFPCLFG